MRGLKVEILMSDQNVEPSGPIVRTMAIGTVRFVHDCLTRCMSMQRAHHPVAPDISSTPALDLMGHGIELTLKAFLLGQGMTARELRKLGSNGHGLMMAFATAVSHGLDCQLSEQGDLAARRALNHSDAMKEFKYMATGATCWPRFSILSAVACKLYDTVAPSIGYNKTLVAASAG